MSSIWPLSQNQPQITRFVAIRNYSAALWTVQRNSQFPFWKKSWWQGRTAEGKMVKCGKWMVFSMQNSSVKFITVIAKYSDPFSNYQLNANSFILQQYVCYTTILNMFRAARCSSSGRQIFTLCKQPYSMQLESAQLAYCTAVYRGWRYQRLWRYNLSSWGWAACCSKHVEDRNVTCILLKNKKLCIILLILKCL